MKKNEKQAHDFSLFRYNRGVGRRRRSLEDGIKDAYRTRRWRYRRKAKGEDYFSKQKYAIYDGYKNIKKSRDND